MNKVKINFKPNTINQEIESVFDVLEYLNNSNCKVFLPKVSQEITNKIKGCEKLTDLEKDKIKQQVKKEYTSLIKQKKIIKIKNYWTKNIKQKFFDNVSGLLKIKPLKEYTVYLTQYGCGGRYWPPDRVIVNINLMSNYTIAHEIVHLMIRHLIRKYKIKHYQEERIVDLYMREMFDEYRYYMQIIDDEKGVKRVGKVFKNSHELGAEKMIKLIKE